MKNILLLGGTGPMGTNLTEILLKKKDVQIHITSRKDKISEENIVYHKGDAHNLIFLEGLLASIGFIDVVVDFMVYETKQFKEIYEFFLDHCNQYFYFSSSRVYADKKGLLTESDPRLLDSCIDQEYLKTDEYALAKAKQEKLLLQSGKKNWTIIRPYITFGDYRLQLGVLEIKDWLYRALHGRSIIFSKDIADKTTTLTYGYDVALGISSLIGKKYALGEIFHITSNTSQKWSDILNTYLEVLKKNGYEKPIVYEEKCHRLYFGARKYQVIYDRYYNRTFDNSKILKYVNDYDFHYPPEVLKECLEHFIQNPKYENMDWITQAYMDRISSESASCDEFNSITQYFSYLLYRYFPFIPEGYKMIRKMTKFFLLRK